MRITFLESARRLVLATAVACLLAAMVAATVFAAPGNYFAGSVSLPVTGGLAVDQTTSDVFVADAGGISKITAGVAAPFVPGGTFSSLAVDDTPGTVYAVDTATPGVSVFDSAGVAQTPLDGSTFPFFNPSAVAVDPSNGDVYVANVDPEGGPTVINVFNEAGEPQPEITAPEDAPFSSPSALALDGSGNLYVLAADGNVNRYSTTGVFQGTLSGSAFAMAADAVTGDVYVVDSSSGAFQVTHYASSGAVLFTFGANQFSGASGLGVDETSGTVYVAEPGVGVAIFDAAVAPDVTTGDATPTTDSADLAGTVDPLGQANTFYRFDWGTDTSYGNSTESVDVSGAPGPVPAAATIGSLLPNQEYHYRLVANNDLVSNAGADATFTTAVIPPTVSTGGAEEVRPTRAKVDAIVNPNNTATTTYAFEYGTTTGYGQEAPIGGRTLDLGTSDVPVSEILADLQPATEYHYRITADNGTGGPQNGDDRTFTTPDPLAAAAVHPPSDVTKTSATLHGTVDSHGFDATYTFTVRGTDSPYVASTPQVQLAPGAGTQAVSASIGDLPSDGGFEVRLVATTSGGSVVSEPLGFRTHGSEGVPPAPPIVDFAPYGCTAPHLDAYSAKARRGRVITLTGSDLGVGGVVSFGSTLADVDSWRANAIRVVVPSSARGSAAVKVDCSRTSNTIKVGIAKAAKKKATKCKRGYVKKKVKGKSRCVKKKAAKGKGKGKPGKRR